jgi:bifunctional lysine-specific demethylase and histidyl-hydroxylase NO66
MATTALERCVGDVERFLTNYWARAPLHRSGSGTDAFAEVLTLDDIDGLLAETGLRFPALRVVKDGETFAPSTYTKRARLQSLELDDVIDPGRVYDHFSQGATIVLQALHRYWSPLSHFCRELEMALTHPVQVNVYLTPPSSRGLDIHYDTHDVFVLQISGVKHWAVYGESFRYPLANQKRKGKITDPGEPLIDVELKPGDSLYIPRGFLHGAETVERESAHLTIGILSYTWIDVINELMGRASDQVSLRESLPPGFAHSPEGIGQEIPEKLEELVRWLRTCDTQQLAGHIARKFWSKRPPILGGQLHQILSLDSLTDSSRVRRRKGTTHLVEANADEIALVLGDRTLHMPVSLERPLHYVLEHGELSIQELAEYLDPDSRLVFVRRLVKEGLLEQVLGG